MATTPVFLPGESHGQRSLAGYGPQGPKELDTTEHMHTYTHTHALDGVKKRGSGPESEQWQRSWREGDGWPDYM